MPHSIMHPDSALPGIPRENAFVVLDESRLKRGSATVVQFINEVLLPERPLNYYVKIAAENDRAFDLLLGASIARSLEMKRSQPDMPARIYVPCPPENVDLLRNLQLFGFQNDDAEIRMRRLLRDNDRVPLPPVGCSIAPVVLETESDWRGLLSRINRVSLTARDMNWLMDLQRGDLFIVYGVWQESRLLGELILTVFGYEGYVEMLYTRPEYQKRGIATALIAHAGDKLQQNGIHSLNAVVWKRNTRAMNLFLSQSFDSMFPDILYPGVDV